MIERMKRKKAKVEMYNEWQEMIATKYETVAVNTEMIKNYKQHFQQHFKASVTSKGHKFKISEYKQFRFSTLHKLQVHASQSMNGVVGDRFTLLKPNCQPNLDAKALYQGMVPVKKAKLDDVKSLYKYLQPETIEYIDKIPTCDGAASDDDFGQD